MRRYVVVWLEKDEGSSHGRVVFLGVNSAREAVHLAEDYNGVWMTREEFEKVVRGAEEEAG